jgi:hypothetical protein
LGHEYIIQYALALHKPCLVRPDNLGELHTEPTSKGLGQNFIETSQEGDRFLVIELLNLALSPDLGISVMIPLLMKGEVAPVLSIAEQA